MGWLYVSNNDDSVYNFLHEDGWNIIAHAYRYYCDVIRAYSWADVVAHSM
jgi:hypothetical protein